MSAPHMNEERLAMFAEGRLTADESRQVAGHVDPTFDAGAVDYVHLHNAKRGCFAARIDRG